MNKFIKAITAIVLRMFVAVGCNKPNEPIDHSGTLNGHDYVDLALPSGTLWATCNVGAETPEGYGDYFAWGETRTKDNFEWSTYQYAINSMCSLIKYCSDVNYGYEGFTDTLTFLLPEDDAAIVNLGAGFRIPSEKEWEELYQNTTSIWTSKNGVNGRLFTASNGNSIFLPAAGFRHGYELVNDGSKGHYWSNKILIDLPHYVRGFNFTSGACYMGEDGRLYGLSVRPVCSV